MPRWTTPDWPENHRDCVVCKQILPFECFHKLKKGRFGYNTTCKSCRQPVSQAQYKDQDWKVLLYNRAKTRATKLGREFTITVDDIVIPDVCPVFNVPMVRGTKYAPSLDRMDSTKGYVPGNVKVISLRANVIKNDATAYELQQVTDYVSICEII